MQMPLLRRSGDPSVPGREVPHIPGEDKREHQRQEENRKKGYRQRSSLAPITNVSVRHLSRDTGSTAVTKYGSTQCWLVVSEQVLSVSVCAEGCLESSSQNTGLQFPPVKNLWKTEPAKTSDGNSI